MRLVLNDKNEIIEFASLGDLTGSVDFNGKIPDDFEINFKSSFYLLQDGVIITNPDYTEPLELTPEAGPTELETQLAALAYQQMTTQQTITNLQTQNAQMAYQLMTAQGGTKA
ncbi:DUF2977 domain-containing protein [Lactiplantibacillus argentoratensis]|uniref:DUF2977 domain-containing protein n=1 Tax=Lactiplantibacillus argentoratensis TaxID=271881 RepID=UPI001B321D87|nr:DUF2977 domain-containing protein [Lactiplantibacillus argentoratensis]MBP5810053.1 DUF2977 domain-containing protein [Lactiplantibacillus argentoratensis]